MKKKKHVCSLIVGFCMIFFMIFAMQKSASAYSGKYWLKINRTKNTVTVYKRNSKGSYKAYKAMICSVGTGSLTPTGTYYTKAKYRWHTLMGPSYAPYCTRIVNGILFHPVWYYAPRHNEQSTVQYNKLGKKASHGCVRMTVADALWIYNNCKIGTKVTIYDSSKAGPLGKPSSIKVSTSKSRGWDPTDPSASNPYKKNFPKISISGKSKSIAVGDDFSPLKSVTAKASYGKKLTVTYSGKVNTNKVGKYTITYKTEDKYHRVTTKKVTYTVKKLSKPAIEGVSSTQKADLNGTYKISLLKGVKAKDRDGKNITKNIEISISPSSGYILDKSKKTVTFTKAGTYQVTYKVTGKAYGKMTVEKKCKIQVNDSSAVKVEVKNAEITIPTGSTYGSKEIMAGVTAITEKGTKVANISYDIYVDGCKTELQAVDTKTPGRYAIVYCAVSDSKKKATNKRIVRVAQAEQQ